VTVGRRYLGLEQAVPIAVGHHVEVQIFRDDDDVGPPHVVVRDLTTGILYAEEKMLSGGAPDDGPLEGEKSVFRLQHFVPSWRKLGSRFRGRVVECTVARFAGPDRPDRSMTSLAIDEDVAPDAPYR